MVTPIFVWFLQCLASYVWVQIAYVFIAMLGTECSFCLFVCFFIIDIFFMCVCVCVRDCECLWKLEEDITSPGTGVTVDGAGA